MEEPQIERKANIDYVQEVDVVYIEVATGEKPDVEGDARIQEEEIVVSSRVVTEKRVKVLLIL